MFVICSCVHVDGNEAAIDVDCTKCKGTGAVSAESTMLALEDEDTDDAGDYGCPDTPYTTEDLELTPQGWLVALGLA